MKERGEQPSPLDDSREEGETTFNHPDDDELESINQSITTFGDPDDDDDDDTMGEIKRNLNRRIAGKEIQKPTLKKEFFLIWGIKLIRVTEKNPPNFSTG